MVLPFVMAGLQLGASLLSGFGAQKSAKKQAKAQAANDMIANQTNQAAIMDANRVNRNLAIEIAKELRKTKEVTTEKTSGGATRTTSSTAGSVDYERMMADAEKAGFNPVTYLNAGAMSAYARQDFSSETLTDPMTVTTTRSGHNAGLVAQIKASLMSPQVFQMNATQAQRIPDTLEVVGKAGSDALSTFQTENARQVSQDFQKELLGMQLDAIKSKSIANKFGLVPNYKTAGGTTVLGGAGLSGSKINGKPVPLVAGDAPSVTNPNASHWLFPLVDPTYPDVKTMTDREGESEIFETFNSGMSKLNDVIYNITGLTSKERAERYGKPVLDFFKSIGISIKEEPKHSPLMFTVKPKAK